MSLRPPDLGRLRRVEWSTQAWELCVQSPGQKEVWLVLGEERRLVWLKSIEWECPDRRWSLSRQGIVGHASWWKFLCCGVSKVQRAGPMKSFSRGSGSAEKASGLGSEPLEKKTLPSQDPSSFPQVTYGHAEANTVDLSMVTGRKSFWNIPRHLLTTIQPLSHPNPKRILSSHFPLFLPFLPLFFSSCCLLSSSLHPFFDPSLHFFKF